MWTAKPTTLYVTQASQSRPHRFACPPSAPPAAGAKWRWYSSQAFPDIVAVVPVFAHAGGSEQNPLRACEHHSPQQVFNDTCASIHDEGGETAAVRPIVCVHDNEGDACYAELYVSAFDPPPQTFYFAQSLWAASGTKGTQLLWEQLAATMRGIPREAPVTLTRAHVQGVTDRALWIYCGGDNMAQWEWYNEPQGLGQSHPYPHMTTPPGENPVQEVGNAAAMALSVGVPTPPQLFQVDDLTKSSASKNNFDVQLESWYMYPACSVHPLEDADDSRVTWSWSDGKYTVDQQLGPCVKLKSDWRGKTVVFRDPERLADQYVIFNGQDIPYLASRDAWRVFLTMRILCEASMLGQQFTHVVTDTSGTVYACTKSYFQSNVASQLGVRVSSRLTEGICPYFMCHCETPEKSAISGISDVARLFKGIPVSLEAFSKTMAAGIEAAHRPSDNWLIQVQSGAQFKTVTAGNSNNVIVGTDEVALQFGKANGDDDDPYITIGHANPVAANPASALPLWHNLSGGIVATEQGVSAPRSVAIQPHTLRPIIGSSDLAFYSEPDTSPGAWSVSHPSANQQPIPSQYCAFGFHRRMTQMAQFRTNIAFYAEAKSVFHEMQVYKQNNGKAMLVAVGLTPNAVLPFSMPSGPLPPRGGGGSEPSGSLVTLGVCGAGLLLGFIAAQRGHSPARAAHSL